MSSARRTAGLLLASVIALAIAGCGGEAPEPVTTEPAVTTPQASLAGEWVLTRTVTASDDTTNPARAVGAESVRLVLIEQEDCETALCPGTVTSGITLEDREQTALDQTDGGLAWAFEGTIDCLRAGTATVQVPDAFSYTQTAQLTVAESAEVDGELVATTLVGTMSFTDTLDEDAADFGCERVPATTTVEYQLSAVRVPAA